MQMRRRGGARVNASCRMGCPQHDAYIDLSGIPVELINHQLIRLAGHHIVEEMQQDASVLHTANEHWVQLDMFGIGRHAHTEPSGKATMTGGRDVPEK